MILQTCGTFKGHFLVKLYICDNLFRVLAVFPKMKGFYMKAETVKVYWNRRDFALDDHVWQRHVVVFYPSGGL